MNNAQTGYCGWARNHSGGWQMVGGDSGDH